MPTHAVHKLNLGDRMVQCRLVTALTVNSSAAPVWKHHILSCRVLWPQKVAKNKVFLKSLHAHLETDVTLTQVVKSTQCHAVVCQYSNHTALLGSVYLAHL